MNERATAAAINDRLHWLLDDVKGGDQRLHLEDSTVGRQGTAIAGKVHIRTAADTTYYRKIQWGGTAGWLAKRYAALIAF